MKKVIAVLLIAAGLLGVGGLAFAQGENGSGPWNLNFEQMLPFMKQMHPQWSEDQLKDMYNSCHGPNGVMQKAPFNQGDAGTGSDL